MTGKTKCRKMKWHELLAFAFCLWLFWTEGPLRATNKRQALAGRERARPRDLSVVVEVEVERCDLVHHHRGSVVMLA